VQDFPPSFSSWPKSKKAYYNLGGLNRGHWLLTTLEVRKSKIKSVADSKSVKESLPGSSMVPSHCALTVKGTKCCSGISSLENCPMPPRLLGIESKLS
jgi:hypothetical protein